MATLINGNGNPAIYAQQDADFYNGIMGPRTRILNVGSKMAATIEDANTIAIADGVIITKEGRRVQVDVGNVDEFIIPTGQAGATRYYIIGYHLYTDGSANQLCETFVQLMANGTDTIPEDTFRGGSTDVYVSLYRVKQDGITLDTIQSLLPEGVDLDGIGDEIDDIKDDINQINSDLTELGTNKVDASKFVTWAGNRTTGGNGEFSTGYSANDYFCIGAFQSTRDNYQVDMYIGSNGAWFGRVHAFNSYSDVLASQTVAIRLLMYKWR